MIGACFAIEIFLSEVYNGPLKQYLVRKPAHATGLRNTAQLTSENV